MAKPEWGAKRTCYNCSARFYDLCRETIVCPVCSTVFDPERQPRIRRGGVAVKDEISSRPKVAALVADDDVDDTKPAKKKRDADDVDTDDDDSDLDDLNPEDQDLIEDTSDLGEDGDDIGEVMEHIDEDVEDKS